jgi:hypothetical protein
MGEPTPRIIHYHSEYVSTGPHGCPGKTFAVIQMRHLIARLVLTFDLTLSPRLTPEKFMKGFKNIRTNMFDEPLMVRAVKRSRKLI